LLIKLQYNTRKASHSVWDEHIVVGTMIVSTPVNHCLIVHFNF